MEAIELAMNQALGKVDGNSFELYEVEIIKD